MRVLLAGALTAGLWRLFALPRDAGASRKILTAALAAALAWTALTWTRRVPVANEDFPLAPTSAEILLLWGAGVVLGGAVFAAARGRKAARSGAAFGLAMGAVGLCASRWPQLARALELCGSTFVGPVASAFAAVAMATTVAALAAALALDDARAHARVLVLALLGLWVVPTLLTEVVLVRWWGFGPRSLAEAARAPSGRDAELISVVWLSPSRGQKTSRETLRAANDSVDLSPQSLAKLQDFLGRVRYRDVFAAKAMAAVRQGWRLWWEPERALDALMTYVPGRVHPDYRRALDLIKAGPLNDERFAKLERLARFAVARPEGFEDVAESQYIFEGFSAAYARFGEEPKAREWLYRIDRLWPLNEKKIEVTPVEIFRDGTVTGSLQVEGQPAGAVLVGLFMVWKSSPSGTTTRLLSDAAFPDENGRFSFGDLGPGHYALALLGRPDSLRGRVRGSPGVFEVGEERPLVFLPAIHVDREVQPVSEAFSPAGLPPDPTPEVPDVILPWPRR